MKHLKKNMLGMEDHELTVMEIPAADEAAIAAQTPIAVVEIIDEAKEISEIDQTGRLLTEVANDLETVVEDIQEIAERGNVTVEAYGALVRRATSHLGSVGETLEFSSLESTGSLRASTESLGASVIEKLKKFWQGVINAFHAVKSRIVNFIKTITDSNMQLRLKAQRLVNSSAAAATHFVGGRKPKVTEIKVSGKYLSIGGKVDGHGVEVGLRDTIRKIHSALPHIEEAAADLERRVKVAISKLKHDHTAKVTVDAPSHNSGLKLGPLLGDYKLVMEQTDNHAYFALKRPEKPLEAVDVDTPLPNVVHSVATEIVHLTGLVEEVRATLEKVSKLADVQMAEVNALITTIGADTEVPASVRNVIYVARQNFAVDLTAILSYLNLVGSAACVFCARAVHSY